MQKRSVDSAVRNSNQWVVSFKLNAANVSLLDPSARLLTLRCSAQIMSESLEKYLDKMPSINVNVFIIVVHTNNSGRKSISY